MYQNIQTAIDNFKNAPNFMIVRMRSLTVYITKVERFYLVNLE